MEANMTERDWSAWLRILDANSGEIFFDCEHCGTGDYGWNRINGGESGAHFATAEELFAEASWVMRTYKTTLMVEGYLKDEFLAWYHADSED